MSKPVRLLIGTRKGGFILKSDSNRENWNLQGPFFLGSTIHHMMLDPRDGRTLLMAARTGHLGPTVFRSTDEGQNWKEATEPPAFKKVPEGEKGRVVNNTFWLTPGHESEPDVWYAGTSPQGLFRSEDGGVTWKGVDGFNEHPMHPKWAHPEDGTPGGPMLHSINIDPRDPNHMYFGLSGGGFFESVDKGADWKPLNKGCEANFLPEPDPEYGHDPHCAYLHPQKPDRLYQQNHCGIYRLDRPSNEWVRIGKNMPEEVGDIGFPITLHPRDPDTVWVFPMDGTDVWPRTSPGGKPAVYVSRDAGESWKRQDKGFPDEHGYFTVYRHAMSIDNHDSLGLYLGTSGGEIWASFDEGESWKPLIRHLPQIYAVEVA